MKVKISSFGIINSERKTLTSIKGEVLRVNYCKLGFRVIQLPLKERKTTMLISLFYKENRDLCRTSLHNHNL